MALVLWLWITFAYFSQIQQVQSATSNQTSEGVLEACGFEFTDLCSWDNTAGDAKWRLHTGANTSPRYNPYHGNTYLIADNYNGAGAGDSAILQTPTLQHTGPACVHFAYYMTGYGVGNLTVSVGKDNIVRATDLLLQGNHGDEWKTANVDIFLYNTEHVSWTATLGDSGYISIDEVWITAGKCSMFRCDFERGPCMEQSDLVSGEWLYIDGSRTNHYIFVDNSPSAGDTAIAETPALNYKGEVCIHFSYMMQDSFTDTLSLSIYGNGQDRATDFNEMGDQGNMWQEGHLTAVLNGGEKVRWTAVRGGSGSSLIALDNIHITPGECALLECDFEGGMCLQPALHDHQEAWQLNSPGGAMIQLSAHRGSQYAYASVSDGDCAGVETPPLPYNGDVCVHFAYHTAGCAGCELRMIVNGTNTDFHFIGNHHNEWREVNVTARIFQSQKVEWVARQDSQIISVIALDDIRISKGKCDVLAACDFEDGMCLDEVETSGWKRQVGPTHQVTGPQFAHVGRHYLLAEASDILPEDIASVQTAPLMYTGPACVHFAYYMHADDMSLTVAVEQEWKQRMATLFTVSGTKGNSWKEVHVTAHILQRLQRIRWTATASTGLTDLVAIDGIHVTRGACPPQPILSCDFEESDWCLVPSPFGHKVWSLGDRFELPSVTWPSTTYQGQGFLQCDTSGLREGEQSTVSSAPFNHSGTVHVHFARFMSGLGVGKLSVGIYSRGIISTIYDVSNDQGNAWQEVDVTAVVQASDRISWTVTRGPSGTAMVAIDDVHVNLAEQGSACGGIIRAQSGVITSPLYPQAYPSPLSCTWTLVHVPLAIHVDLMITDMPDCGNCACDSITVTEAFGGQSWGPLCGAKTKLQLSSSSPLIITMETAGQRTGSGFWLKFSPEPSTDTYDDGKTTCGWSWFNISLICAVTFLFLVLGGAAGYLCIRERRSTIISLKHDPGRRRSIATAYANDNFQMFNTVECRKGGAIEKPPLPHHDQESPEGDKYIERPTIINLKQESGRQRSIAMAHGNDNFQIGGGSIEKAPLPHHGQESPDGDIGLGFRLLPVTQT